ncbi:solute carrier family 52, riboflavin transporter, member 3-B-like [Mizuhopecten yessoensis]|uniref:Riboflavin transporter n=1 Tax=Mizuhopecten yessoensis TaxID=6573 RepID=A0A210PLL4_MIZYE|nr:solute carrier family 52, riboflavin transporter, member 3-B-like [Mizuhopecten yessoensis]OWF37357.1 Riboflavin transporter 2 [Mizuhopecten yessoensis]
MKSCNGCRNGDVNFFVYLVVILFGVGSWVAVNGVWVELPIMVPSLPEGWKLPSYLTVIIQLANIGPLLVMLAYLCCKNKLNEKVIVYGILIIGAVACVLMAFFWDQTSTLFGEEHSVALFVLDFFLSFVDCTSSVLFLPFMALFHVKYMTALYIGEGLSGLLPSLVALGQGVGKMTCQNISDVNQTTNVSYFHIKPVYQEPSFPFEYFCFFLCGMMFVCGVAFTLLNYLPYCKKEHVTHKFTTAKEMYDLSEQNESSVKEASKSINPANFAFYLFLITVINSLTNGVLAGVQSYSCIPYGNDAYHLTVTLSKIANPVTCFVAFLLPVASTIVITIYVTIATGISAYIILMASQSPTPWLYDDAAGPPLMISAWVIMGSLMTFSKLSIASILRQEGKRALIWCGAVTQIGSLIGAVLSYVLVNVLTLFESAPVC